MKNCQRRVRKISKCFLLPGSTEYMQLFSSWRMMGSQKVNMPCGLETPTWRPLKSCFHLWCPWIIPLFSRLYCSPQVQLLNHLSTVKSAGTAGMSRRHPVLCDLPMPSERLSSTYGQEKKLMKKTQGSSIIDSSHSWMDSHFGVPPHSAEINMFNNQLSPKHMAVFLIDLWWGQGTAQRLFAVVRQVDR